MLLPLFLLTVSINLCGQKARGYREFDFFKLTPLERVVLKKKKTYNVAENDTLLKVIFAGAGESLCFKIKKGEVPFSENIETNCCTGIRNVSRRFYFGDSIVEYHYTLPTPIYKKNADTLLYEAKRVITTDSIYVNYYDSVFAITYNYDSAFTMIEASNFMKVKSWKKYIFLNSLERYYVQESSSWSNVTLRGYLYCGPSFRIGWWNYKRWTLCKTPTILN